MLVLFDITSKEHQGLLTLLEIARHETQLRHQPDGFHIGFNDGEVLEKLQIISTFMSFLTIKPAVETRSTLGCTKGLILLHRTGTTF